MTMAAGTSSPTVIGICMTDIERTIEDVRSEIRTEIRLARFGDEVQP